MYCYIIYYTIQSSHFIKDEESWRNFKTSLDVNVILVFFNLRYYYFILLYTTLPYCITTLYYYILLYFLLYAITTLFLPRLWNTGLVFSMASLTSWGGVSLALVGHPSSDGVTIKMPYGVDVLHRPALHPIFSCWVG